ncbi:MAG TPA: cell division protein ZipA C-terminal FtsZ-binding domain-containing protein, partial [Burkholderiaceae bacterium]
ARELDAFAGQHDAQLAVRLVARGVAWSVGYLQQQAGRHGFVPGVVPGRMILPAAEEDGSAVAPPVLTLEFDPQAALVDDPNRAALRSTVLAFDVPQTPAEAKPFARWVELARALSDDLDADVLDDRGQPLADASFAAIERELERLYEALAARDLAAGSAAARRLFA